MSIASRATAELVVRRYRAVADPHAVIAGCTTAQVLAVVCQESAGNPFAVRVERGFFTRYLSGLTALVKGTTTGWDNYWMGYPDLFSASYGLMQVMYPVSIELGMTLRYPTELCDPDTGIRAGCLKLAQARKTVAASGPLSALGQWRKVLLKYNGGGNPTYPDEVIRWEAACIDALKEAP